MATVNVHAAKTHFSQLLERVAQGEEVVIATPCPAIATTPSTGCWWHRPGTGRAATEPGQPARGLRSRAVLVTRAVGPHILKPEWPEVRMLLQVPSASWYSR